MWADSPPFMLIVPGRPADVPPNGATITSWQRAMICKKWNPRVLGAISTYRDTYRGTGPEQVPSLNTGTGAKDLPKPGAAGPDRLMSDDDRIPRTSTTCSPSRARSPRSTACSSSSRPRARRAPCRTRSCSASTRRRSRSGARRMPRPSCPDGEDAYRALGWDVVRADRGGRSTWHGPGQLVCYPILDLRDHGKDLRRYAHDLEQVVIEALAALGISAVAGEDREHVGVWVEDRKIASLGIRADNWVVRHGFALNVDCDLGAFARFRACGLDATPFTSVAQELGRDVTVEDARGPVLDALARVFSLDLSAIPA